MSEIIDFTKNKLKKAHNYILISIKVNATRTS